MLLTIVGMPGSGKSSASKFFKENGARIVLMRDVVESGIIEKGMEVNNQTLREYATQLRQQHGNDIVARKCLPLVERALASSRFVVIDGIRGVSELKLFKAHFGELKTIALLASPNVRFDRLRKRGEKWDMENRIDFAWRDQKEIEWGIAEAIIQSDYFIVNEGTEQELMKKLDELLRNIM